MSVQRRGRSDEAPAMAVEEEVERPPRIWKTVTMAVLLFVTGSLMLFYGVQSLGQTGGYDRGVAMCSVGSIAFLPGSYATWHLYGAWRRWPGYTYDLVPSYDE